MAAVGETKEIPSVPPTDLVGPERDLAGRQKRTPRNSELAFGLFLVAAWVLVLAGGIFVPTDRHRNYLADAVAPAPLALVGSFAIVLCCYTITNTFFLAVISSCLGCMTCRWRVTGSPDALLVFYAELHPKRIYLAALLRGFLAYLAIISGLLMISTEKSVVNTTFDQYLRVAGLTSLIGFLVGYDPQIAYRLIGRANNLATAPAKADDDPKPKKKPDA